MAPLPPGRQRTVLAVISATALLVALTQSLLIPLVPSITTDLGTTAEAAQWLLTATLLAGALAVPVLGRLADLHGERAMVLVALAALVGGSAVSALGTDLVTLVAGRAVVGVSLAAIPLGISLVGRLMSPQRVGLGIAVVSALLGVGAALGLPVGALVDDLIGLRGLFWACAAAGLVAVLAVRAVVPATPALGRGRTDLVGAAVLAAALLTLLLPLSQAASWGWASPRVLGLLGASVLLLVGFVALERRRESPLVDLAVAVRRGVLLANLASSCVGFALFATLIGTAAYVQAPPSSGYGFGTSVLGGGLAALPSGLAMVAVAPLTARLVTATGPRLTLALGSLVIAAGFGLRIVLTDQLWQVVLGTAVAGAGAGVAYAALPALVLQFVEPDRRASANGVNALFRSVGSAVASAVGGTMLAASTVTATATVVPALGAYQALFAVCAAAAVVAAVTALALPRA